MAINRSNIKLQVTRGNKMKMKKRKAGGSFPDVTGDGETTMKDVLVKRGVLEKKGDKFVVAKKESGGDLTKDIKKIKERNRKRGGFDPKIARDRRTVAKPRVNKPRQVIKRKGGGMAYQLYGGSTKDFSDGNKFIQSFYDKGGK
jgi:hypothetical protein|tara:strand:- start:206 stop:637 length:432 start_codon:yes stop_codon:yes gene_type:complete